MTRVLAFNLGAAIARSLACRRRRAEREAEMPDCRCRGENPPGSGMRCTTNTLSGEAYCGVCKTRMPSMIFGFQSSFRVDRVSHGGNRSVHRLTR